MDAELRTIQMILDNIAAELDEVAEKIAERILSEQNKTQNQSQHWVDFEDWLSDEAGAPADGAKFCVKLRYADGCVDFRDMEYLSDDLALLGIGDEHNDNIVVHLYDYCEYGKDWYRDTYGVTPERIKGRIEEALEHGQETKETEKSDEGHNA